MSDPTVHTVVVLKAHQVGFTAMLGNLIGYHVHQYPSPILVIQPTEMMASAWSQERLDAMFRDTPALRDAIADPRSRDSGNTVLRKRFPGGYLAITGANSPSSLASRPIRIVIADETDKYPASADDKGDPLTLARHRQTNFPDAKTFLGSTPGHKAASVIWREWLKSDMRRFHVACPRCKRESILDGWPTWARVTWDKELTEGTVVTGAVPEGKTVARHLAATARLECQSVDPETGEVCDARWTDADRLRAIQHGRWIASAPFNGVAGFHVTGFMSPWQKLAKIVQEFLDAKDHPAILQTWVNETLGEPWEEGDRVDEHALMKRAEAGWGVSVADPAPAGVLKVTCGVDVQPDRFEITRMGWAEGEESWSLDHRVIHCDPNLPESWVQLDDYLLTPTLTADGRRVEVASACVDSGGHNTQAVYSQCNVTARLRRKVWAIKGQDNPGKPIWPRRASRTKRGQNFFIVSVDPAKDAIYARLRIDVPGPGYMHFPDCRDLAWFEQLTAEKVITKWVGGRPKRTYYKKAHERNEALDCAVYSYAALLSLGVNWEREKRRALAAPREPVKVAIREETAPSDPAPLVSPSLAAAEVQAANTKRIFARRVSRSSFMR